MISKINYYLFTILNIGKLPLSGTFGSFFTIIFYYLIYNFFSTIIFIVIFLFILFYSLFFLKYILSNFENEDPKEIIIDEFIGQSIPLLFCNGDVVLIIISFITFRFFDITKIFPANFFDKKIKGSIGIIGDDIVAGIYSLILILIIQMYQ